MIVWLHGKYEVVRVAPYAELEQLSAQQRWSAYARENADSLMMGARA